jgi:PAS domain S-box-containing protein
MSGLDGVFAASRDLVLALDASGAITYRNPAAAAHEIDRESLARIEAAARKVAASRTSDCIEWGELGATGVLAWYSAEVTPYDDGALVVSRDITAMRRREHLMLDTQGVAHLGTWEWDVSKPNATWSSELYRIYGLTPETYTPSYEAYLTMVHPDDRQRVMDATNRVFHEHVPYSHDERIMRPDGSLRYLHTWAYPVLDEAGKLTHLIGVCQDITDRALLEAFNSMVSHDLRGPLGVIQMATDLLASIIKDNERGHTYLDRIRRAIANMNALMDDLLAFARVGEGPLQVSDVDVTALATEIVGDLRTSSPSRNVTVTIAPDLKAPADPRLFRALLTNLVQNAWKYTGQKPNAEIEIGRAVRAGSPALFVRDNGIGFDPKDAPRVFAPFERLKNAIELPGTGIGLSIVQKIAERHGARVEADSKLGEGATFYVTFPGLTT